VLCHQGEATSGHYFSYIRDRATGQWNEFNDSTVSPFDVANLQSACFGGTVENREKNLWGECRLEHRPHMCITPNVSRWFRLLRCLARVHVHAMDPYLGGSAR